MSEGSVHLQPLIGWPKNVHRGEEHLVTVDFRLHEESGEWPYEAEEVALTCVLDGGTAFRVESVDDNTVIVHRFGGTYSPTRFVVRATPFADLGPQRLTLTVMSERGAVLRSDVLRVNVLTDQEHELPEEQPKAPELLPRPAPAASLPTRPSASRVMSEESRPFFFLSYARSRFRPEESDRWVVKFFNDLCHDVAQSTGTLNPGFMDRQASFSDQWPDQLADALGNCRVFVSLLSPAYFSSDYCGREWGAFLERYQAQAVALDRPSPIIPVMWTPLAPAEIPEQLHSIQFVPPSFPAAYSSEGIYGIMKLGRYREQYKETVLRLALVIKERAAECALAPGPLPDLRSTRNPFAQSPLVSARAAVRIILLAPTVDRLPPGRDAYYYGRTSLGWMPFRGADENRPVAEFAQEALSELGLRAVVEAADEPSHTPLDAPTLVIVDPWSVRDDATRDRLRQLVRDSLHFVPLYNADDQQTMEAADDLHAELFGLFTTETGMEDSTPRITSLDAFRRGLGKAVDQVIVRYLRNAKASPPEAPAISQPELFRPDG